MAESKPKPQVIEAWFDSNRGVVVQMLDDGTTRDLASE